MTILNTEAFQQMNDIVCKNFPRLLMLFLICACIEFGYGQSKGKYLLKFDQEEIDIETFERVYQKNNGGYEEAKDHSLEQYKEYLELYINFKRKVYAAKDQGLHETDAFKSEFEGYRKQLAQPYLSSKEVEDKLIEEAYERSKTVVNADHILLAVNPSSAPEDTLAAFKKILAIRDTVLNGGKTFGEMARRYSQDPSAKQNGGNLGYFSVFDMVYPFENAAFKTGKDGVSEPIRTQFGYHLVKVNDKLSVPGKKRVSHIIIRIGERYSARDSAQAVTKINEIYEKIKGGESFASMAIQFSDDPNSASKGGDLGTARLLPSMEALRYQLDLGEVSKPFATPFGWHIMTVSGIDSLRPLSETRRELRQRISRDSRSQLSRAAMIKRIKKENNFQLNQANFDLFAKSLDDTFAAGNWQPDSGKESLYNKPLFSIGEKEVNIQDFVAHYQKAKFRRPGTTAARAAQSLLESFSEQKLLAHEEEMLPVKNPSYRYLLEEYHDGILLFTLMEQKVWKKAVEDTSGLKAFYIANKDSFYADVMVEGREYRASEKSEMEAVGSLLKQGASENVIDSTLNSASSLNLRISTQTYELGKDPLPAKVFEAERGYQSEILQDGESYRIIVLEEKYPAGTKPFEKAKSECITMYQDHLEKTWLAELAEMYPVRVNEKALKKLFK